MRALSHSRSLLDGVVAHVANIIKNKRLVITYLLKCDVCVVSSPSDLVSRLAHLVKLRVNVIIDRCHAAKLVQLVIGSAGILFLLDGLVRVRCLFYH